MSCTTASCIYHKYHHHITSQQDTWGLVLIEQIVKEEESPNENSLHLGIAAIRKVDQEPVSISESFLGNINRLLGNLPSRIPLLVHDEESHLSTAAGSEDTGGVDGVDHLLLGVGDLKEPAHGAGSNTVNSLLDRSKEASLV